MCRASLEEKKGATPPEIQQKGKRRAEGGKEGALD